MSLVEMFLLKGEQEKTETSFHWYMCLPACSIEFPVLYNHILYSGNWEEKKCNIFLWHLLVAFLFY